MRATLFTVLVSVATAYALNGVPGHLIKRQSDPSGLTDADILNFALTLEHLESTFYSQGLANYSSSDFQSASNLGGVTFNEVTEIGKDEANHVSLLTGALSAAGATPVQACNYSFPATDAHSFLGLAQVLEGVGVSAYLGAAQYIANPAYLEVAGSILTVEARHNAFIRLANGYSAFPSPYDTGLSPKAIVSLAGSFFVSCPNGSAPTITPFPAATVTSTNFTLGSNISVSVNSSLTDGQSNLYCSFASGVVSAFSPFTNGSCQIPTANITGGQTYLLLTTSMNISDASTIAGPAILNLDTANVTITGSNSTSAKVNTKSGASALSATGGLASFVAAVAYFLF